VAGLCFVGTFCANERFPARIVALAALKPGPIIDNIHTPRGCPIREVAGCAPAGLRNYLSAQRPTLEDLFQENAVQLGMR
jgi:hypothetical protein